MKLLFTIITFLISTISFGQQFSICEILHVSYNDTGSTSIKELVKYNANGKVISEIYIDTVTNNSPGSNLYFYKDTLLLRILQIDEEGDSSIVLHSYNKKGQQIKSLYYNFENNKEPGKDVKKTKQIKTAEIYNTYDKQGNKILEDATKKYWSSQNKQTWVYDNHNRVIEHNSYIVEKNYPEKIYWTERYEYYDHGYRYTTTIYDTDGKPKHLKEKSWEYSPQYTTTIKLNNQGQVVEEVVTDEKGVLFSKQLTFYNESGSISKIVFFNQGSKPRWTAFYEYKK